MTLSTGGVKGEMRACHRFPIQDHALAIARGLRLPHDACAHTGLNVVVDSIDDASITPVNSSVVVGLSGRATVWVCTKILGAPLKTRIVADSVSISVPVELFLPNPQTIALRLSGPATIKTGDALTEEAARAAVPPVPGLDVTIENAAFVQDGPRLTVRASGRAAMTSVAFANLLGFIGR
jgi:hypothetical protein